jgi:hypothetical protein
MEETWMALAVTWMALAVTRTGVVEAAKAADAAKAYKATNPRAKAATTDSVVTLPL